MKKLAFALVYIILILFSVNFSKAEGNTALEKNSSVSYENNTNKLTALQNRISLSIPLSSKPTKPVPEPINFSLFLFGFFIVVGFGWIKKTPDKH